jgi:hypothetical protein
VLDLSFQERFYLIQLINEKQNATKKAIEDARSRKNK